MEKNEKSHLAKVLGVEEDKTWSYPGCFGLYRIHSGVREYWDDNNGWLACDCEEDLIKIIAHPEAIIRTSLLTEPELAICKAVGAKWVSMNAIGIGKSRVTLWDDKPIFDGSMFYITEDDESSIVVGTIGRINQNLFPSVHPGDLIPVDLGK